MAAGEFVHGRIPALIIGAIKNAHEPMRIFAQHDLESTAAGRRLNLARVMFARGRDSIGIQDSAFQQIQPAEEFESAQREVTFREIGERKIESPKAALIREMMDG